MLTNLHKNCSICSWRMLIRNIWKYVISFFFA